MLDPKQGYWAKRLSEEQTEQQDVPTQEKDQPLPIGVYFLGFAIVFFLVVCSVLSNT